MKEKTFLLINHQIKYLRENKLFIDNLYKFKWYISNFNYKNIVSGYDLFFKINNDKNSIYYKKDVTSSMFIELFNIDRGIAKIILSDLLSIERKLSTLISYVLMTNIIQVKKDKKILDGMILSWSVEDILFVFPSLNKVSVKTKKNILNIDSKKNVLDFKRLIKSRDRDNKNLEEKSLWNLCLNWTLGETIFIFKMLRIDYRKKILEEFFKDKKIKILKHEIIHFEHIFVILNIVRNICCHNNILYDFWYKIEKKDNLISFVNRILINDFKKIKLFVVIDLINFFSPHNTKLIKLCNDKFNSSKILNAEVKELINVYVHGK